jgi:hypothetical protein
VIDEKEVETSGTAISGAKLPSTQENDKSAEEEKEKTSSPQPDKISDTLSPVSIESVKSAPANLESGLWEGLKRPHDEGDEDEEDECHSRKSV